MKNNKSLFQVVGTIKIIKIIKMIKTIGMIAISSAFLSSAFMFSANANANSNPNTNTTSNTNTKIAVNTPFKKFGDAELKTINKEASAIILIKADWCSTCITQEKLLTELSKNPRYQSVKFYMVNFDQQKNILKHYNIANQSTVLAFKNGKETARIIAQDSINELQNLLDKSL